jgi:hypothetical protein
MQTSRPAIDRTVRDALCEHRCMAVIELTTFRLTGDADERAFLEADKRVQQEFSPFEPGFARRTTARGANGEWAVVVLWASAADADASAGRAPSHPAVAAFDAFVEPGSTSTARYTTLD